MNVRQLIKYEISFTNGKIKLPFLIEKRHIIKTYDTMLVSNQTLKEGFNYVSTK